MEVDELLDEISALEAIYGDGMHVDSQEGALPRVRIIVRSENEESDAEAELTFTYEYGYPNTLPQVDVRGLRGVPKRMETSLATYLKEKVAEYEGMVMTFSLASDATTWIEENCLLGEGEEEAEEDTQDTPGAAVDTSKKPNMTRHDESERFGSIQVTEETFNEWKIKFEAEVGEVEEALAEKNSTGEEFPGKLTGREWFSIHKDRHREDFEEGEEEEGEEEKEKEKEESDKEVGSDTK
eukprot:TRINITY_DN1575_c3_g1_i1.p1 TRINITY_DN1575_c3_g1~~TRINITY_DN1575_c3_g1_i1.p1  ORF type:complete len:239 (+),score=89.86 TRINITY_DN1575_c3_g1_i1:109-825(+)